MWPSRHIASVLPDIDDPDQLFRHKPQRERVQQEGEDTERHLRSDSSRHTKQKY